MKTKLIKSKKNFIVYIIKLYFLILVITTFKYLDISNMHILYMEKMNKKNKQKKKKKKSKTISRNDFYHHGKFTYKITSQ